MEPLSYFRPKEPGSYAGLSTFKQSHDIANLGEILQEYPAYTLHKPVRKHFPRNKVVVNSIDQQWQTDLSDLSSLSKHNDGYKYLACFIDVLSKKAWIIPLKGKTAGHMLSALEQLFSTTDRRPLTLQADKGTEYLNKSVQAYLKRMGIHFFTTQNEDIKAQIVERYQRTMKGKMFRYFTHNNTHRYIDVLADLVDSYNNTHHRSINRTPNSVNKDNEYEVWSTLYGDDEEQHTMIQPFKFQVGDYVRISTKRSVFAKGYMSGWSEEIFKIKKRQDRVHPTYVLEDLNGEVVEGSFYALELQKVKLTDDVFIVEKVLKRRRRRSDGKQEYLVKWRGYPSKFNSWTTDLYDVDANKQPERG